MIRSYGCAEDIEKKREGEEREEREGQEKEERDREVRKREDRKDQADGRSWGKNRKATSNRHRY